MNWLAIIVGALINIALGSLWYSPLLFANQWMKLIGKTEKDIKGNSQEMGKMYGVTFVSSLVMSVILMHFIQAEHVNTVLWGVKLALWLWVGFVAATTISDYLFSGRPIKLYFINTFYYLLVMVILGGLFGVWH